MAHLLQWKEPRSVGEWEWKNKGFAESRKVFFMFVKWSFLIGIPVLIATHIWLPEGFWPVLYRLLTTVTVIPLIIVLPVWLGHRLGKQCFVTKKGLIVTYADKAQLYWWKEIESYNFADFTPVSGVRVLKVKVQRQRREIEREFRFSPQDVSESQIEELMRQHLPRTPWASQ